MVDTHGQLVSALNSVLPTHYELALTANTSTPCISYQERDNAAITEIIGATVGYSRISYTIKVWSNRVEELQQYALEIDRVLRPLGFKRINSQELHDPQSTMIQKIMAYEALVYENY